MKLEGDSISNGEISASVLSRTVESFQELISSIINKILKGEQSRGKISNDILSMSEIKVAATTSGSFKILFTGSSTLEPNGEDNVQTKAMNILSDIISQGVSSEKMEKIKQEMGPRTISKFKRMVEIANRDDISITLFEDDEYLKKATLANGDTENILNIINEIEMKPDEDITLVGRLFDIKFDQRKFKISSTDGQVVTCDKIELDQKQINTLNNQAKYSVLFTIKISYKKAYDKEFLTYIARSIEVLDAYAYSDIDDPKAVHTEKRPLT